MDSKTIYLDYSATTPIHSKVWEEMGAVYGQFGNASSIHQIGQKSNYLLSQCRNTVAQLLGCQSQEIIFTGGATESNNLILQGIALQAKKPPNSSFYYFSIRAFFYQRNSFCFRKI